MAAIKISSVRKSYDALEFIHDVDLGSRRGELVILVRPSGG